MILGRQRPVAFSLSPSLFLSLFLTYSSFLPFAYISGQRDTRRKNVALCSRNGNAAGNKAAPLIGSACYGGRSRPSIGGSSSGTETWRNVGRVYVNSSTPNTGRIALSKVVRIKHNKIHRVASRHFARASLFLALEAVHTRRKRASLTFERGFDVALKCSPNTKRRRVHGIRKKYLPRREDTRCSPFPPLCFDGLLRIRPIALFP